MARLQGGIGWIPGEVRDTLNKIMKQEKINKESDGLRRMAKYAEVGRVIESAGGSIKLRIIDTHKKGNL